MLSTGVLFVLAVLSSLSLWFFVRPTVPIVLSVLFFLACTLEEYLHYQSVIFLCLFLFFTYIFYKKISKFVTAISFFVLLIFLIVMTGGGFPHTSQIPIFTGLRFSSISSPYWLDINIEKTLCGVFMAALLIKRVSSLKEWKKVLQEVWLPLLVLLLVLISMAFLFGYIKFDFKFPKEIFYFIAIKLTLTCFAEEVFFRGFLQNNITSFLSKTIKLKKYAPYIAMFLVSIIFGYVYMRSGFIFAFFAFIESLGYGYAYQRSGKIETSILVSFGVNIIHFIFFTYSSYQQLPF